MKKRFYQSTAFALSTMLMLSVCKIDAFAIEQISGEADFDYIYIEDQCAAVSGNQNVLVQLKEGAELPTSASLQYHNQGDTKKETIDAVEMSGRILVFSLPCGADEKVVSLDQIECKTEQGAYTIHFAEEKTIYQVSEKNETDDAIVYLADGQSMTISPMEMTIGENVAETALSIQDTIKPQTAEDNTAHTGGELFRDVKKEDWFYPAVSYVMNKGLMSGLTDGNFGISETINRAQLSTI